MASYLIPSLYLAGTPDRNWRQGWHFPGIWAVRAAAVGSWALCQPRDQGETRYSRPGACRPGEGLGSAQDDVGSVPGIAGTCAGQLAVGLWSGIILPKTPSSPTAAPFSCSIGTVSKPRTGWPPGRPSWTLKTKETHWTVWRLWSKSMRTLTKQLMSRWGLSTSESESGFFPIDSSCLCWPGLLSSFMTRIKNC